jgi:DNA polymerase-3 subunit gamma/tau
MDVIVSQLEHIAGQEKMGVKAPALNFIARQAAGGLRDAISLLDQLSSTGEVVDLALAQTVLGTATSQTVLDLIAAIQDSQPAAAMDTLHTALDAGADARTLAHQIVDYLRGLMLVKMGNSDQVDVTSETKASMQEQAKSFSLKDILRMLKAFNAAATNTRGGWQPSLGLELALAEMFDSPAPPAEPAAKKKPAPKKESRKPKPRSRSKADKKGGGKKTDGEPPEVRLKELIAAWRDIRAAIKPNYPSLDGLLNSCKPLDVQGNELVLGFQSDTVRELMEKNAHIEHTRTALKEILGVEMSIKCVVTNAKGQLPSDVNPDGMVATAIQNGGEIVDLQD